MNRVITRGSNFYLNQIAGTYIGTSEANQSYKGLIGAEKVMTRQEAQAATDPAVTNYSSTTLLEKGVYKLVQLKSSLTGTVRRGVLAYWSATAADLGKFIVTCDQPTGGSQFAGVFLNAPTASQYAWIQIKGLAYVLSVASPTKTAAVGDLLFASVVSNVSRVDNHADATAITAANLRSLVGVAFEALSGGAMTRMYIKGAVELPGPLLS